MTGDLVKIEMTREDAQLFLEFQENYEKIKGLLYGDILSIKNGRIIMDFDAHGTVMKVRKEYISFKVDKF